MTNEPKEQNKEEDAVMATCEAYGQAINAWAKTARQDGATEVGILFTAVHTTMAEMAKKSGGITSDVVFSTFAKLIEYHLRSIPGEHQANMRLYMIEKLLAERYVDMEPTASIQAVKETVQ